MKSKARGLISDAHLSIDSVIELGLKLSGVHESPYYGVSALKLDGRMLACTPVLIRLSRMSRADLERTLRMAWDFLSSEGAAP
jgi:hypothetical protein